jgi:hypothetical protein
MTKAKGGKAPGVNQQWSGEGARVQSDASIQNQNVSTAANAKKKTNLLRLMPALCAAEVQN